MSRMSIPRYGKNLAAVIATTISLLFTIKAASPIRILDSKVYHLGTPGFPEWEEFEKSKPHGRRLDVKFNAEANKTIQTLLIRQRQVKFRWSVLLNNQRIGSLLSNDSKLVHKITVPPNRLRDGENTLSIVAPKATDDIEVGPIQLSSISPELLDFYHGLSWIFRDSRDLRDLNSIARKSRFVFSNLKFPERKHY